MLRFEREPKSKSSEVRSKVVPLNPSAEQWLSSEFQQRFSEEEREQRKNEVSKKVLTFPTGLSKIQGDAVETFAPLVMLANPGSLVSLGVATDVVVGGSPYDKENQQPEQKQEQKPVLELVIDGLSHEEKNLEKELKRAA
ncbi:MAG: hypothetical protein LBQ11_02790 [Candidatus Nomurabacteria bacterium]|jgi:hypothetical protein|nr:hypothetical protein [Candidatus Nomurabacteria bacterium]